MQSKFSFYVVGFIMDPGYDKTVVLIKKNSPDWQKGKLNGIGGKIEWNERPMDAMIREGNEEAGVLCEWKEFCHLTDDKTYKVYFFVSLDPTAVKNAKTMTEEEIIKCDFYDLPDNTLWQLRWLIPLALDIAIEDSPEIISVKLPLLVLNKGWI